MFEVELHFPASEMEEARSTVHLVEASCPTELANIAYKMQMKEGYRGIRNPLTGKTKITGLRVEYVSFGPVIKRDEDGLPAYKPAKSR